ncbi:MAG TPA: hypothetical protein VF746_24090 [Longimicrobium sp.]|jgi:hypothetical protein
MLNPGLRLATRSAVLGITLFPCTAAAAPVPQPRALEAALRRLDLTQVQRDTSRLGRGRFPLSFPVDRFHGAFKSADTHLLVVVHGHGPTTRRYRSISFEMLFYNLARFEADLATTIRTIAGIGLPEEVQGAATEVLRSAHARWETVRNPDRSWVKAPADEVREAAGIQIRLEGSFYEGPGGSGAYVILQFTDADAPEVDWPSPREVEDLQPHSRRRLIWCYGRYNCDVPMELEPEVLDLRCRPAGPDAFRCSYVVAASEGRSRPGDRYTDLFRRGADGRWSIELRSASRHR